MSFGFLVQSVSASVVKSLVAHWKFDAGKGDSIKDSSVNGIEREIAGKVKWVDGKHGKAVEFADDGKSIIKFDANEKLNFRDDFSVVFWAKTTQVRGKKAT